MFKTECGRLRIEYRCADYIARHKVWRKLYAAERHINTACQQFCSKRFCYAGYAFNQHMAIGKNGGDQELDHISLPHNYFGYFVFYFANRFVLLSNICSILNTVYVLDNV